MIFDIAVLVVLLISCGVAFLRGFIREVLTILGVAGGGVAALFLGPVLRGPVRGWLGVEDGKEAEKLFDLIPYTLVADAIAWGGIFLVVVALLSVLSHYLCKGAQAIGLGALDRAFGVLFGIARAAVIIILLYMPFYFLFDQDKRTEMLAGSRAQFFVEAGAQWAASRLTGNEEDSSAGNETREKLRKLDLLRGDQEGGETLPDEGTEESSGYDDSQRRDMQNLIGGGVNE